MKNHRDWTTILTLWSVVLECALKSTMPSSTFGIAKSRRSDWPGRKLAALEANAGVPGMADEFDGSGEEEGIGVEEDVKRLATDHGAADPIVRTPICDSDSENALFRVRGISSTLNRRQDFGIVYGTGDRP